MPMKREAKLRFKNGFSLLEVMMTLAIGSIVMAAIGGVMVWTAQSQTNAIQIVQLEQLKQHILRTLHSTSAWTNTITNPKNLPAMACLQPGSAIACPANMPTPFALFDGAGAPVFDATVNTTGFTYKGTTCPAGQDFNMITGNDECPYRFELRWQAVCAPGGNPPCLNPQVLLTGHLFYRPARGSARKLIIDEDRFSINGFYLQSETACTGGAQQVFLYNSTPGATLNTNFVVPVYTKNLYVEMWGGGGGGASYDWLTGLFNPGAPGEATTFNALSAAGGPGANGTTLSNQSWFYSGPINPIWIWTGVGSCNGSDGAAPTDPALLNGLTNKCTPVSSTNNGGKGGVCTWIPDLFNNNPNKLGQLYGGGGASAGAWITDCATWAIYFDPTTNVNNGGQYQSATFTPATLPPGTVVPITVGAGGTGGLGHHITACWGIFQVNGGAGANGLIKITWE